MAERTEILSITLDTKAAEKRLADIVIELEKAKKEQQELSKAYKEGLISEEAYGKGTVKLKAQMNELTTEQRGTTNALDNYVKQQKAAKGSNDQMRAQLSVLTRQYNALSKEERENTEAGRKLEKQTKELSDALKKSESAVGDNRRSVGGYAQAILSAVPGLGKLQTGIQGVNGVMTASPIGLFTQLLGVLPAIFGSSGDNAGMFTKALDQVNAVINVFTGRAKLLAESVQLMFSGEFSKGAALAKKSFAGIGDEIEREVEATGKLTQARYNLEREEAKNIGTSKKLLNEIERLKNVRDNEFNSIEKRNEANEKAFALEMRRQATLENIARKRVAIIQKDIEIAGGTAKASTELLRTLGEAEENLYDILEDSAGKQNELITNRYQLNKELEEKQQAERLARLQKEKVEIELKLQKAQAGSLDELKLKEAIVVKELQIENSAADVSKSQRKLNEAKAHAEVLKLRDEFGKQFETQAEQQNLKTATSAEETFNRILEANRKLFAEQQKLRADDSAALLERAKLEKEVAQQSIALAYAVTDEVMANVDRQSFAYKAALKVKQAVAVIEASMALPGIFADNMKAGGKISALAPPATIPLGIAYTVAADALAVAKVAMLVSQLRNTKIDSFYDGGYTTKGNPFEEANNLGDRPYVYHKSEYIAPARVVADPIGAYHVQQLEMLRTGKSFFQGGYSVPAPTRTTLAGGIDNNTLASAIGRQFAKLPAPVVEIKEVTNMQNKVLAKESRANH